MLRLLKQYIYENATKRESFPSKERGYVASSLGSKNRKNKVMKK